MAELNFTTLKSDANLKSYYRFENGFLTLDSSGQGKTLTDHGTILVTTGKFGGGIDLGTANSTKYYTGGDNLGLTGTSNVSLSIWVKMNTEIGSGEQDFIMQETTATYNSWYIGYQYNAGTRRIVFVRDRYGVGADTLAYNITLGTTNWHHLVLTHVSGTLGGYIDGGSAGTQGCSTSNGNSNAYSGVTIGSYRQGSGNFASCLIDDASIFNKVLSGSEVTKLYSGANDFNPSGFVPFL